MPRDYKHRANTDHRKPVQSTIAWWKWFLIILIIALFVFFLAYLRKTAPKTEPPPPLTTTSIVETPKHQDQKPQKPHFEFYNILPKEVVVPDDEINTRDREEQFGKQKPTQYILQVGSFRDYSEADRLRARLALMGIESRIEKAEVGHVEWNRVKMGPFKKTSSVTALKNRLKSNGIDVVVIEEKT
jgi:cell division protein FtsN